MPCSVTAVPRWGWCSAAPRPWQGCNWFVRLRSPFLPHRPLCSCIAQPQSHKKTPKWANGRIFPQLDYSLSESQGSVFWKRDVIHFKFDTSSVCSTAFSLLIDVGDTRFFSPTLYTLTVWTPVLWVLQPHTLLLVHQHLSLFFICGKFSGKNFDKSNLTKHFFRWIIHRLLHEITINS